MKLFHLMKGDIFFHPKRCVPVIVNDNVNNVVFYTCLRTNLDSEYPTIAGTSSKLNPFVDLGQEIELLEFLYEEKNVLKFLEELSPGDFFIHPYRDTVCITEKITTEKDKYGAELSLYYTNMGSHERMMVSIGDTGSFPIVKQRNEVQIMNLYFSNEVEY